MVACPACGHKNDEDALRCAACGAAWPDDPLAGLEGLLPDPNETGLRIETGSARVRAVTDAERSAAALLQRIATEPTPLGRPQPQPQARSAPLSPWLRRLLYLLVLLAALTPLATGDLSQAWISPRPQVARLAEMMARIPAGERVLVAMDYAPAYGGELDPLAEAVLADLAQRGVALAAVSTRPEGVGVARRVLSRAATRAPGYRYGEDYVILGFLPGEERGLRLLTEDLAGILPQDDVLGLPLARLPALQNVASLDDFQAVLLLTDDANTARRWIEQVVAQTATPTYALATARVEPLLMPYLQSGQLAGLVGGTYGALEYPKDGAPPQGGLRGADGQLALWGVFALTALLANLGRRRNDERRDRGT